MTANINMTRPEGIASRKEDDKLASEGVPQSPLCCSVRLLLAGIAFIGFALNYGQRIGMSVAIVCMVNQTAVRLLSETNVSAPTGGGDQLTTSMDGPFVWRKEVQGHVLGAFFYGYLLSQIPAGLLAERYGGKRLFAAGMCLSSVSTLLVPFAARLGYAAMIALRVVTGIGSGGIFPIMHTIWGRWAPPLERSKLTGISYAGAMLGNVIYLPTSGVLCASGGWPYIFYLVGVLSLMWCVLWVVFASDSPAESRRISESERRYIATCLGGQTSNTARRQPMPWRQVAKSPAVWAIVVANFTSDWGLYTLLTNTPTYMRDVLHFDIKSNGFLSALPFLGLWVNMTLTPILADFLRAKGILSTTTTRKLFNFIGQSGAAALLVALGFVGSEQSPATAVTLLVLATTVSGAAYCGFLINHIDIAPLYAGTLLGVTNSIAAVTGFVAPYLAASLTTHQTQVEWRRVFLIAAAVYLVGAVVFAVFASGELQPWGVPKGALDIQSMDTSQTAGGKRREHDDTDEQTTMLRDDETASHKDVLS